MQNTFSVVFVWKMYWSVISTLCQLEGNIYMLNKHKYIHEDNFFVKFKFFWQSLWKQVEKSTYVASSCVYSSDYKNKLREKIACLSLSTTATRKYSINADVTWWTTCFEVFIADTNRKKRQHSQRTISDLLFLNGGCNRHSP